MKFFHSDIPRTDKVGELIFYLLDPFVSLNMGIYKLIGSIAGKSASKVVLYLVSTNRDDIFGKLQVPCPGFMQLGSICLSLWRRKNNMHYFTVFLHNLQVYNFPRSNCNNCLSLRIVLFEDSCCTNEQLYNL